MTSLHRFEPHSGITEGFSPIEMYLLLLLVSFCIGVLGIASEEGFGRWVCVWGGGGGGGGRVHMPVTKNSLSESQRIKTHTPQQHSTHTTTTTTHTLPPPPQHTLQVHIRTLLVVGWSNEKKTTDQYAEKKIRVFSFDLIAGSEDQCLSVLVSLSLRLCR